MFVCPYFISVYMNSWVYIYYCLSMSYLVFYEVVIGAVCPLFGACGHM